MQPLVSQLWPQFMGDGEFAQCFGNVIVEQAQMIRTEKKIVFTLQSAAPLDKTMCARLLLSLEPDFAGFELSVCNRFGYAHLDEQALRGLMEEISNTPDQM